MAMDPRWLQAYAASVQSDGEGDGCVFCAIVHGHAPSHIIEDTEHTLTFLDQTPATWGHALVVPKTHCRDLFDIPDEDYSAVMATAKRVAHALRTTCSAAGVNLVHASGKAAHQTEWHFHVHVVPRYDGDDVVVFPRLSDPDMRAEAAALLRTSLSAPQPTESTEPTES